VRRLPDTPTPSQTQCHLARPSRRLHRHARVARSRLLSRRSPMPTVTPLASRGKRRAGLGRPSGAAQSLLRFGVQGLPPCMPVRGSYPAAHPWPASFKLGGSVRDARLQRCAFHAPLEVQGIRPVCPFTGLRWSTGPTVPAHPWLAVVSFSYRSSWKLVDARPRKGQRRLTGTGLDHPPSPFGHPTK